MNFELIKRNYADGIYSKNGNYKFKEDVLNAIKDSYDLSEDKAYDIYSKVKATTLESKPVNIYNFIADLEFEASSWKIIQNKLPDYMKKGLL